EGVDRAVGAAVPLDEVLQRRGNEEILLPQPQLAPGRCRIARIEHLRDCLGARLLAQRTDMVAEVENVEPHRTGSACGPQTQRVDVGAAPADDWRVVGYGPDRFRRVPDMTFGSVAGCDRVHTATEENIVGDLRALEFPRVAERQPFLGKFLLPPIL